VLLVVDVYFRGGRAHIAKCIESLAPLALPAFLVALIMLGAQNDPDVPRVAIALRPLVVGDSLAFYLGKLVLPHPLLIDYGRNPVYVLEHGSIWWAWIAPAVVFGLILWSRSRRLLLAAALFVIPLAPVSGIIRFDMQQYSTVADHYMYQPLLGVGLAVALAVQLAASHQKMLAVGCVAVLGALAAVTTAEARRWQDMRRLHLDTLAYNPDSAMVAGNLGFIDFARGNYVRSEQWSELALRLNPKNESALTNMSVLAEQRGDYRTAADYLVRILPSHMLQAQTPIQLMRLAARLNDRDLAEKAVRRWLVLEPGNQRAMWVLKNLQAAGAATRRSGAAAPPSTAPAD